MITSPAIGILCNLAVIDDLLNINIYLISKSLNVIYVQIYHISKVNLSFFTLELNLLCGCIIYIQIIQMLQNKIYQNFSIEILKNFLVILLGLSLIALTVRAVSFLDLIVDDGYPINVYFQYSFLNLFGIATKFIPFSFLLSITIFIGKHLNDKEFIILWCSGVNKISLVNLFLFISVLIFFLNLFLSSFLAPYTLYKSRLLLGNEQIKSILPAVKIQEFSDTFKGLTFRIKFEL